MEAESTYRMVQRHLFNAWSEAAKRQMPQPNTLCMADGKVYHLNCDFKSEHIHDTITEAKLRRS